jgi:hypothetical protein
MTEHALLIEHFGTGATEPPRRAPTLSSGTRVPRVRLRTFGFKAAIFGIGTPGKPRTCSCCCAANQSGYRLMQEIQ